MNPTSMAFEKAKYDALSQVSEPKDRADIMKIKIETETKEATATGASSGAYIPKLSLFSDEAPKTQRGELPYLKSGWSSLDRRDEASVRHVDLEGSPYRESQNRLKERP